MGIRDDNIERAQDQPPASRELSLNQGTLAIMMEEPIKAAKNKQRKRAPKKEKPPVQSDARPEVLEVENKNQGTHTVALYSSYMKSSNEGFCRGVEAPKAEASQ